MPRLSTQAHVPKPPEERLDLWLWAARFFKTRSLSARAIDSGKVRLNELRVRRSAPVRAGDIIEISSGPQTTTVVVNGVSRQRRSATEARLLYQETAESEQRRELIRAQLSTLPQRPAGLGRPSKRDRRDIRKLKGEQE